MGYIQPSMKKNVVDMAEYKGRKARRQIDQSHNPSRKVTMTDIDETRGDDAPPHGIPRPTGAGKIVLKPKTRPDKISDIEIPDDKSNIFKTTSLSEPASRAKVQEYTKRKNDGY